MELSGRLSSFPIAELLHWAANDRRTGSLVLRSSGREKRIYFREGKIVTCLTDEPSEYYGQFLLLAAYLDQDQLYRCLSLARERGQRLGQVLEDEGVLGLADVQRTLRYHIEDVICDVFLWDHGIFFFRAEGPPDEDLLAEPISPVGLALEGSHWVDEVRRIREVFVDDNVILGRTEAEPPEDLTPRKRRILAEVDSVRRLEALWGAVHGSFYRFLSAAFQLYEAGLVEIAHYGRTLHPRRPDVGLDDLLFEQAAKEQALARHQFGNLSHFERFVPVWVRPPAADEWDRMPETAREFYGRFDGVRRLGEILSHREESWVRELELLMLQIGKEAVALLPAPLAELEADSDPEPSGPWRREVCTFRTHRFAPPEED